MDRWLSNAPALVFVKDLSTWFIVNNNCEPVITWTEDDSELAWFFACLECGANDRKKLRVVKKFQPQAVAQTPSHRTPRPDKPRPGVLPMRAP